MSTKGKNLARVERDRLLDGALEQTFPASDPVALMPGSGFGMPGHIRISFATSEETLRDAIKRLAGVLQNLRPKEQRTA